MELTIFTPTYNRENTLKRLYDSLRKQTNYNFEWLIVDDGSTDNTRNLVNSFNDDLFPIRYVYQKNSGKHIATNLGMSFAKGELFTCLDSDDWFYTDAVEFILYKFNENSKMAGMIALDTFENKNIVGEELPKMEKINWVDLRYKYKVTGDKCYVFRIEKIKNHIFPQYGKSKHMPPSYQLFEFSRENEFYIFNKPLKFVEYQPDGITSSIRKQYIKSSENYCEYRKMIHPFFNTLRLRSKNLLLFNISWIHTKFDKNHKFNGRMFDKIVQSILLPFAFIIYIKIKGDSK